MRELTQKTWFRPALLVVLAGLVYLVAFGVVGAPDHDAVERRIVERYDLTSLEWDTNGMRQRDTLVLDGQDVSGTCVVAGTWGSADDARLDCSEPIGIPAVDADQ